MSRDPARVRIGISGWTYASWRGVFYPKGLVHRRELEYASRRFDTIEINGSFYSLQRPGSYRQWRDEAPEDFVFAVKGNRFVTHMKKLIDVEAPLANFFASGVLCLGKKLGPILWQFPPILRYLPDRLERFLALLPRDTDQAARLARKRDSRMEGRSAITAPHHGLIRHALEVRHESYVCPEFIDQARRHQVAVVFADTAKRWPYLEDVTSDFVYVRLHGDTELYRSGYGEEALDAWAERVRGWASGARLQDPRCVSTVAAPSRPRDVYVYFDNDAKVHAPFDALSLAGRLRGAARSRAA